MNSPCRGATPKISGFTHRPGIEDLEELVRSVSNGFPEK